MSLYLELQPPERVVYVHGEGLAPDRVHALGDVAGLTRTKIGFFKKIIFVGELCVFVPGKASPARERSGGRGRWCLRICLGKMKKIKIDMERSRKMRASVWQNYRQMSLR